MGREGFNRGDVYFRGCRDGHSAHLPPGHFMKAAKTFGFSRRRRSHGCGARRFRHDRSGGGNRISRCVGKWDPALLFVMAGAVAVYWLGMFSLGKVASDRSPLRSSSCAKLNLPTGGPSSIDRQLVVGASIFGMGWGSRRLLLGTCSRKSRRVPIGSVRFCASDGYRMLFAQKFFGADR